MKVIGRDKLTMFARKHAGASGALDMWDDTAARASWATPRDIKARFSSADFLSGNRVIFNIKGNRFRLVAEVNYEHGWVAIEWVGTHAEYDKQTFR
jgi:mRNA interferase HigB